MGGIVKCRSSDRVNCDGRPPFLRDSLLLTTGIVRQTGSDYSCCWAAVSFSSTGLFSSPVGRTTATRVLRDRQSLARLLYNQLTSFQADARPKVELALSSIAQVSTLRLSIRTNGSLCLSKLPSVYRGRASLRLFPSLDLIRNSLSLFLSDLLSCRSLRNDDKKRNKCSRPTLLGYIDPGRFIFQSKNRLCLRQRTKVLVKQMRGRPDGSLWSDDLPTERERACAMNITCSGRPFQKVAGQKRMLAVIHIFQHMYHILFLNLK